jgi:hypothetical protein
MEDVLVLLDRGSAGHADCRVRICDDAESPFLPASADGHSTGRADGCAGVDPRSGPRHDGSDGQPYAVCDADTNVYGGAEYHDVHHRLRQQRL